MPAHSSESSSQDRLRVFFEHASDGILIVNLKDYRIESSNKKMEEITGYLKSELDSNDVGLLCPKGEKTSSIKSRRFSRSMLSSSGYYDEAVLVKKDGFDAYVSMSINTIQHENENIAICIIHDISEKLAMERDLIAKHRELFSAYQELQKKNEDLKIMQETLVQSGKLAALGELSAGIAHELNQPLTGIKGFAQELKLIIEDQEGDCISKNLVLENTTEIIENTDRMHRIIDHLRNFSRKSVKDMSWTDIHTVIKDSLVMLGRQLEIRGIEVARNFQNDLPKIYSNPFQLEQVFINLATNARDALEAADISEKKIEITTSTEGKDHIIVVFTDNGCGIPKNIQGRIYDPFFSTKEEGKGMGLGLSISYNILENLGGRISLRSEKNKGTSFTIRLPVKTGNEEIK